MPSKYYTIKTVLKLLLKLHSCVYTAPQKPKGRPATNISYWLVTTHDLIGFETV